MPPPRKVNRLPPELREWLHDEIQARGGGEYVGLTQALNSRLEEAGLELRIGKTAVHSYSVERREFIKYQEEASAWAADWMNDQGLEDEAKRHGVLFQMITTLAFKVMQSQMIKDGDEIDPRELHFLGKLMKDVMSSSGMREKLVVEERARLAVEIRNELAGKLDDAVAAGDYEDDARKTAREIMGFE